LKEYNEALYLEGNKNVWAAMMEEAVSKQGVGEER
jgi:hypothetical protein